MLGSSFQLSHVVPEDPEEEERVPTRVPTTTVAAAFAVLDREHWEREEEGSDDGGVREEGGDEQFQAVVSPGFTEEETGVIREEEEEADETMVVVVREETVHPPSHLEPIQQPPLPPLPVQQREAPVDLLGAAAVGQEPNAGGAQKDSLREHDAVMAGLGRVPEADQVEVIFRDLRYKVQVKVTKKDPDTGKTRRGIVENREILNGISGRFRPGKFTAIMGASGAGKTSLLNVIAGEVHFGEVSGQILVNNKELFGNDIKSLSGFVFQDDVLLPSMTVREAITMSALLRLPPETPQAERNEKVDEMINTLNLTKASNTIIGDSTIKGVSGGERKRCAMGMEMLTRPAVLFLDEPTSGLDTFTALAVIRTLKALAATGRTVIATLHQPSSEIFRLFDDFILMADGRIMYSGPASESISYFGRSGYPCPRNSNPTDFFFMSILNTDPSIERLQGEEPGSSVRRVSGLLDTWDASPENSALATSLACPTRTGGAATSTKKGQAGVLTQFSYLYTRASKNAYRNPLVLRSKVIQTVAVSVMIGLLYLRTDNLTGMSGVQNRIGVLFFLGMINVFTSSNANLTVFGKEKGVFLREHGAGYYNITPYFLGKFMAELPLYVVFPALQTLIVYYMVGLQQE
ncbi:ATP-binding cassette sub- G member 1 [Irineochytrium annulatum]|nr:ATP-binding cassette sub- G member 1 [Irineochytrium annulatum]